MNPPEDTNLGDICEFVNGGAWKQGEYVEDGYPVIQVSNIKNGGFDLSDQKFLKATSFEKYKKHQLKPGDLIIATVGSHATQASAAGRAVVATDDVSGMLLNQNAVLMRSKSDKLSQFYLGYFGKSPAFQTYLRNAGKGAANQVRIAIGSIKGFKVSLPEKAQQERIASVLSSYDDLIENNQRRIAFLEEAAELLYREWFIHFRFPGHEHDKMIDCVPEGWESKSLGEMTAVRKGRNITKNTVEPGGVPVVAGGLAPAYSHNKANTQWPVVTISASGANAGFVNIYHEDVWASDCSVIDASASNYPYFFYLMLKEMQPKITSMQVGAAQPHVYPKDLMRLETKRPPTAILSDFYEIIGPLFHQVRALKSMISELEKARDLLLPRLMDGRLEI